MEQQQSRQQQLHQQQHQSSHHRPRSSQSGSFLQFDNRPCSPSTCRVSDCWSPTSDGLDPAGLSASQQRVTPSRPLGGLEKVIEYRPVQNGHGIELRRITASKEGPVEHIQVVPQQPPPPQQPQWIFEASPGAGPMWPPPPPGGQQPATGGPSVAGSHPGNFSSSQLAMNGSQPCLMIPEVAERDLVYYDDHYNPVSQFVLDAPCGSSSLGGQGAPIIERQRSLPRTGSRPLHQSNNQPIPPPPPHLQPSLSRKGRTHSMGKLPEPPRPSSSQPCLLVAQTVSNRRKRHAQEQQYNNKTRNAATNPPLPPPPPLNPKMGGNSTAPPPPSSKKSSFQRSESFHQPQPHFFVNAQMTANEVQAPAPRVTSAMGGLATPSLSPISVVRNKRANQAHWEKQQSRKNSMVLENNGSDHADCGPVTPILGAAAASCTRRQSSDEDEDEIDDELVNTEDQMTEDSRADDLNVPPPPSPPCTCGKNLELPPTPPLEDLEGKGTSYHHPHCTEIDTLQAELEQMQSNNINGQCGPPNGSLHGTMNHSTGTNRSNRSRRSSRIGGPGQDSIDIIDPSKEKTVNFANCVSPPSPHDPGFMGINNESYPCDCCQIDEAAFRRSYSTQMPCGPSGMMQFSERDFKSGRSPAGVSNGHCSNGIVIGGPHGQTGNGGEKPSKISLPRRGSRSSKRQQQQQQQQPKKFFQAKFHEQERGISLEFGKFVALISISGVHLRRQHWCLLSIFILVVVLCIAIGLPISTEGPPSTPEARMAAVKNLLKEAPLIDGHNDLPWNIRKFIHNKLNTVNFTSSLKTENPWGTSQWSHTDLTRLKQGQVGGQLWVAYAPCGSQHKDAVQVTLEQIDLIKRFINQYPNHLRFVNDSAAVLEAHAEGRIASMISVESGHSIGTSLAVLRMFHRLGAISLTLTHNCNTPWADCSNVDKADGKPEHNGLSSFGKTVIKELNRLGMIIDLSHSSHKTALDAIQTSEAPVIFSHSSAFALCNSTRNVQDDVLKLLAKKKGLVMVNFFSYFLTCSNTSTVNDVVAHLNHIRTVAGIDHVGIGASYDGINATPRGLEDVSQYPELFATLLASGMWTSEDLKKLAGLNFLRVFKEVERVSTFSGVRDSTTLTGSE